MVIYKRDKLNIVQKLFDSGQFRPINMQIDLIHTCDSNCPFCLQGSSESRPDYMDNHTIKKLLFELKALGCYQVGFSGGEPLLRKDIEDILHYANTLGFRVSMISNGHHITKGLIQTFRDIRLSRLTLSLHTVQQEKYKFLFGRNDLNVADTLKAIRDLLQYDIPVGIAATLTKYNIDDIDVLIDTVISLGIPPSNITLNPLIPGKKEISHLLPTEDQLRKLNTVLLERQMIPYSRDVYPNNENGAVLCSAGKYSCEVRYNGDVFPCSMFECKAGNIYERSFKEIWETSPIFLILRSISYKHFKEKCRLCEARNTCRMCLWNNLTFNKDLFAPYEKTCEYSKMLCSIMKEGSI